MSDKMDAHVRKAWDEAILALFVSKPNLSGEQALVAVINAATDAVARLKEDGLIECGDS